MTTAEYATYLKSDWWLRLRELAFEHYGRCCALCGSAESLNVHHRTYKRLGAERLSDLTILCRDCHKRFHADAAETWQPKDLQVAWFRTVLPFIAEMDYPLSQLLTAGWPRRLSPTGELEIAFPCDKAFYRKVASEKGRPVFVAECIERLTGKAVRVTFTNDLVRTAVTT